MLVDGIDQLRSRQGVFLSLYATAGRSSSAVLSDLLRPVRLRAESLVREAGMQLRDDCDRIKDLSPRLEAEPQSSAAVFACSGLEVFEYLPLPVTVSPMAAVGVRPYLRPLRAIPSAGRAAVLIADRRRARMFVHTGDELVELPELDEADIGKSNYGGFAGYREQRVRSRAEEETNHLLRRASESLLAEHSRHPFNYLVLGGHADLLDGVASNLHPYLTGLPSARFVIDSHTMTPATISKAVSDAVLTLIADADRSEILAIRSAVSDGSPSAADLRSVIDAVNAKAVSRLVVRSDFTAPGFACPVCGALELDGDACPTCGSKMLPSVDVVGDAMEAAMEAGATLVQANGDVVDFAAVAAELRFHLT